MKAQKLTAQDYRISFGTPLGRTLLGYGALMGIIALFIPADILKTYPWAVEFTDFMAGWVPQIDRITSLGVEPDVNRFYYSVLWAMSPVLMAISGFAAWEDLKKGYGAASMPILKMLPLALFICVVIYASQYLYWFDLWADINRGLLHFTLGDGWGRAFWGNLVYVTAPVMATGGLAAVTYGRLSRHIPEIIGRQAEEVGK